MHFDVQFLGKKDRDISIKWEREGRNVEIKGEKKRKGRKKEKGEKKRKTKIKKRGDLRG